MSLVNEVLRDLDERQTRESEVRMARTRGEVHLTAAEKKNPWISLVAGGAFGAVIALGAVWLMAPESPEKKANQKITVGKVITSVTTASESKTAALPAVASPTASISSVQAVAQKPQAEVATTQLSGIDKAVIPEISPIVTMSDEVLAQPKPRLSDVNLSISETRNSLSLNIGNAKSSPEVSQQPLQLVIKLPESKWKQAQTLLTMKYWPNITLISSADRDAMLILPLEKHQVAVQTLRGGESSWVIQLNKPSIIESPVVGRMADKNSSKEKVSSSEKVPAEKIVKAADSFSTENSAPKIKFTPRKLPLSIRDKQLVDKARLKLKAGRADEAIESLKSFLVSEPKAARSSALLVDVYLSSGLQVEALEWLTSDTALSGAQKAYYHGRLLTLEQKWQAALTLLDKHQPDLRSYPDYYRFKAGVAQKARAYEQSAKIYGQLLVFESRGSYWLGLGVSLDALNDKTGALNAFKQAQRVPSFTQEVRTYINQRIAALSR
ncbi:MAG: hypothetical protein K6L73_04455 [Cellvibrionaceae bacterium]